jgi:hypothetical protein
MGHLAGKVYFRFTIEGTAATEEETELGDTVLITATVDQTW